MRPHKSDGGVFPMHAIMGTVAGKSSEQMADEWMRQMGCLDCTCQSDPSGRCVMHPREPQASSPDPALP